MKSRKLLVFLLLFVCIASCQKEFDPTGEWQESYAVYCLLNLKDSVQYVRVNRVFLTSSHPAQYYQTADSVNIDPEVIEVSLITLYEGLQEGHPVYFTPTNSIEKEEGLFSSEDYYVFRSSVLLKADRSYRLVIRNIESDYVMQAETDLLGSRTLEYSFLQTRFYNINQYHPESIDYNGSLITSQFEKRVIRLLYYDIKDEIRFLRYIDWRSPYVKSANSSLESPNL